MARKFSQNSSLQKNIQFILEALKTIENFPHPQKAFPATLVPKSLCHISHNYQPPEADFEAIYLEQAQLKGVGGEQWVSITDCGTICFFQFHITIKNLARKFQTRNMAILRSKVRTVKKMNDFLFSSCLFY